MDTILTSLPLWAMASIAMGGGGLIAGFAQWLVHRRFSAESLGRNNEIAGFKMGVVGLIYGLILGMAIVGVWEDFTNARDTVESEANLVAVLARNTRGFPAESSADSRAHLRNYVREVITQEWPQKRESDLAAKELDKYFSIITTSKTKDPMQLAVLAQSLERTNDLALTRRSRLTQMDSGMPELIWAILLLGSVVTIALALFLGSENRRAQMMMTMLLGSMIGLGLFTVLELDHPYQGAITIDLAPMERVLSLLEES